MRIVHINVTAAFSTGRIAVELCRQAMREGHRALLCYARGSCPSDVPGYRIGSTAQTVGYTLLSRLTDRQGFFGRRETEKLVAQLKKFKPDVVHLHNLHGSYLHLPTLFAYLKENDLPTVWTLHDCWAFTGHCAYFSLGEDAAPADGSGRRRRAETCGEGCLRWQSGCGHCSLLREYPRSWFRDQSARNWREKRTLFSGLPHLVLTTPSEWLKAQVESSFLGQYPIYVLPNGIDTDAFAPCADEAFLRNAAHYYGLDEAEGRHLVLSVASTWEPRKGLEDLLELAEKPTTVILDNAVNLAPNLIAEDGSIAMRITRESFSKELCYRFQKPIVSTSANISGEPAAQNYCDISEELINAVDYVCWSRRQEHKPHTPSSIIKLSENGEVKIIR